MHEEMRFGPGGWDYLEVVCCLLGFFYGEF
jgi:hypothetical protein